MQVIWALALQHSLAAVTHEVTLVYFGQIQGSSLSCFTVGRTLSSLVFLFVYNCITLVNQYTQIDGVHPKITHFKQIFGCTFCLIIVKFQ